jgi:hypothetical protein
MKNRKKMKKVSKKSRLYKNQRNRIITTKKQLEKKSSSKFFEKDNDRSKISYEI